MSISKDKTAIEYLFRDGEFVDIDPRTRDKLFVLMARIAEKSYRRGFQQAIESSHPVRVNLLDWRFDTPADKSVSPHFPESICNASHERLHVEHGTALRDLFSEGGE